MKLHFFETELDRPPVRLILPVPAGSQAEEEGDLDGFVRALCEGAGGVGCLRRSHDDAHQDGFFSFLRRVLVREVTKHPGYALFEFLRVGAVEFPGVTKAFLKVGLGDSAPRHCKQVRLESVVLGGVVTVTIPVAVRLKDINRGNVRVFKKVVELQVGA